ncbi:unnamed protein product [Phytophthora fragariaefolia]|uniref:Unnamed protein product n=1 Tax=Phytophthora fragariaefolia TaxID=1490495 RepID=A0A9W6XCV1_9STRA|nr:unnamed protein product [Phytophthora fragariaefolia]
MYLVRAHYTGTACDGTPYMVTAEENSTCPENDTCTAYEDNATTITVDMVSEECTTDYTTTMRHKFGDSPYILQAEFGDDSCSSFSVEYGFPASGNCEGAFNETGSYYIIGRLNSNGSTSIQYFSKSPCLSDSLYMTRMADQETLTSHHCDGNWLQWYSSNDVSSTSVNSDSSGFTITTNTLDGIVFGVLFFVLVAVAIIQFRRRLQAKGMSLQLKWPVNSQPDGAIAAKVNLRGQSGIWSDDVITAKRVPRDKVHVENLISRGAYGEVHGGYFNGRRVAIKMLLPASRGHLEYVNEFFAEAKITASLDHPHIVSFLGVAWDSLSDVCVVLEFMDGGDLRSLLNKYHSIRYPVGFNRQKVEIAFNVCQALTYLHSLMSPVIHRDLKSRNVLLDTNLGAKLSDFGISRERLDRTMTGCVGTSLWMAPEVMLGERYDVKADMFSFRVVLSELDVHTMPYARVTKATMDSNGREMTRVALFRGIALGRVQLEFSSSSTNSVVELGRAFTSVDPTERPSAAEALYTLQRILAKL